MLAAQSAGQFRWTKCECDRSLRSSKTHAGTEQTTLSRLSLADRAWETDDDESLMPGTQITNKTHKDTHTHQIHAHTHTHSAPLSYSSVLSHLQRGVFLRAISDFVLTETDGGIERGMAQQQRRRKLPPPFTLLRDDINSLCWPLYFAVGLSLSLYFPITT